MIANLPLRIQSSWQIHFENAGKIIAQLIIERQLQKIKSREQFSNKKSTDDENEIW